MGTNEKWPGTEHVTMWAVSHLDSKNSPKPCSIYSGVARADEFRR